MTIAPADLTPKARRTRSALLSAARAEIGRSGVPGVTVMAVCARAEVGRTSFYNYFEDVEALVSAVAIEVAEEIKERFDRLHQDMPRGRARLEACLGMILETAVSDSETTRLLVSLSGVIPDQEGGKGSISFDFDAMQNGPADGVALVDDGGQVIELFYRMTIWQLDSYFGRFVDRIREYGLEEHSIVAVTAKAAAQTTLKEMEAVSGSAVS